MTDFNDLLAKLEPAAVKGTSEWPEVAQFSMAVSLKRIADVLENWAEGSFNYAKGRK